MSVSFPKPTHVKALPAYHLYLSYEDDTEGTVDLSSLVNKGVFKAWNNDVRFDAVYIDKESDAIAWNTMLEICPDSLYLKIKGMTFEEWQEAQVEHAANI